MLFANSACCLSEIVHADHPDSVSVFVNDIGTWILERARNVNTSAAGTTAPSSHL